MRKFIFMLAAGALAAAGFVGASLASNEGIRDCVPGLPGVICGPTTSTHATTTATTTTGKTTTGGTTTRSTLAKPTLKLSANAIGFGTVLKLSGSIPVRSEGQAVDIFAQTCGFNRSLAIGHAKTRADGSYAYVVQPQQNATFYVRFANLVSDKQALTVSPKLELRRVSGSVFNVDLSAGGGALFSRRVVLERYDKARKAWRYVASGKLHLTSDPVAIVSVSSATIRASVPKGAKVRASASQATVGQCYRASKSAPITG